MILFMITIPFLPAVNKTKQVETSAKEIVNSESREPLHSQQVAGNLPSVSDEPKDPSAIRSDAVDQDTTDIKSVESSAPNQEAPLRSPTEPLVPPVERDVSLAAPSDEDVIARSSRQADSQVGVISNAEKPRLSGELENNKPSPGPQLVEAPSLAVGKGRDCEDKQSFVDQVICEDPNLSKLDAELRTSFSRALFRAKGSMGVTLEQDNWDRQIRGKCMNAGCIESTIKARIIDLDHRYLRTQSAEQ